MLLNLRKLLRSEIKIIFLVLFFGSQLASANQKDAETLAKDCEVLLTKMDANPGIDPMMVEFMRLMHSRAQILEVGLARLGSGQSRGTALSPNEDEAAEFQAALEGSTAGTGLRASLRIKALQDLKGFDLLGVAIKEGVIGIDGIPAQKLHLVRSFGGGYIFSAEHLQRFPHSGTLANILTDAYALLTAHSLPSTLTEIGITGRTAYVQVKNLLQKHVSGFDSIENSLGSSLMGIHSPSDAAAITMERFTHFPAGPYALFRGLAQGLQEVLNQLPRADINRESVSALLARCADLYSSAATETGTVFSSSFRELLTAQELSGLIELVGEPASRGARKGGLLTLLNPTAFDHVMYILSHDPRIVSTDGALSLVNKNASPAERVRSLELSVDLAGVSGYEALVEAAQLVAAKSPIWSSDSVQAFCAKVKSLSEAAGWPAMDGLRSNPQALQLGRQGFSQWSAWISKLISTKGGKGFWIRIREAKLLKFISAHELPASRQTFAATVGEGVDDVSYALAVLRDVEEQLGNIMIPLERLMCAMESPAFDHWELIEPSTHREIWQDVASWVKYRGEQRPWISWMESNDIGIEKESRIVRPGALGFHEIADSIDRVYSSQKFDRVGRERDYRIFIYASYTPIAWFLGSDLKTVMPLGGAEHATWTHEDGSAVPYAINYLASLNRTMRRHFTEEARNSVGNYDSYKLHALAASTERSSEIGAFLLTIWDTIPRVPGPTGQEMLARNFLDGIDPSGRLNHLVQELLTAGTVFRAEDTAN